MLLVYWANSRDTSLRSWGRGGIDNEQLRYICAVCILA